MSGTDARADVDEDALRAQRAPADGELLAAGKARVAANQLDVLHAGDPAAEPVVRLFHHAVLARLDRAHVDFDPARGEPVLGAAARHVHRARARDQRLGGNAADVDAGPADQLALDQRGAQPLAVQPRAKRGPGLTRADHDRVVAFDLHTSSRLLAGIGLSSASIKPARSASRAMSSKSRRPLAGSLARSMASKRALLSEVCLPP